MRKHYWPSNCVILSPKGEESKIRSFVVGAPQDDTGQGSLEVTVALIIFVILFAAAVRIFVWLNTGVVHRQLSYDNTRVAAAGHATENKVLDQSNMGTLDNVTPDALILKDNEGRQEQAINEPLNADLNLSIEF